MNQDTLAPEDLDEFGLNSVPLVQLAGKLRGQGEDAFRRRFPCGFFVLLSGPPMDEDSMEIKTRESSLSSLHAMEGKRGAELERAIPLLKSKRNAYKSMITIGRARINDVVVRSPKISKFHSCLHLKRKGRYAIQDMESLNGTVVNGTAMKKGKHQKLGSGDKISFWRYEFEFVSLDDLVTRL